MSEFADLIWLRKLLQLHTAACCLFYTAFFLLCLITTCSELQKVLFLVQSVHGFLFMKYLQNCWTDLHQIHKEDVFGA